LSRQEFKYRREDFTPLPVKLNHLTLYINFLDGFVEVTNLLDITSRDYIREVQLDARDLEILRVEWIAEPADSSAAPKEIPFSYQEHLSKLVVELPRVVSPNGRFQIRTLTRCVPSDHLLEGIYKDVTPPGAPQQYMSQCQQWGFQRIAPIFDDCRAKCTMTTTVEADAAYTHLISNGNVCRQLNPDARPILKPGDTGRKIIRFENTIPMAPYLFLVCAGTWDTLEDEVVFPSGRKVRLEYLVPPGRASNARIPMDILKDAVLWISERQDYEYTADTYRTICMTKSNFGGMENLGNTTIVTDVALIDEHTPDQSLLYAHSVIVHEFEHNQCGSETTMDTPFDVWLNEAYTVDVERQFMAELFDPTFVRLNQVESIRNPLLGPLAIEDGGKIGRIVRDGFNDPDELIDGVTYVKAAEVIRMLRLIVGADNFKAAKRLYFSRYRYSNANTEQFFDCFEEVSGKSLDQFKKRWLYTIGYPKVTAVTDYDRSGRQFTIEFQQQCETSGGPFHIPIDVALVDNEGRVVPGTDTVFEITEPTARLTFLDIDKPPAFASMNRDCSFYGTFTEESAGLEVLVRQIRLDPNAFNRVEAMRRLTDVQRVRLLLDVESHINAQWLDVYGEVMEDERLRPSLKAYFMCIDEQPLNRDYAVWYPEQVAARERLMKAVNARYRERLVEMFNRLDTYKPRRSPRDGIEERILKHVLLDLIAVDDTPDSHAIILAHFRNATTAGDRVSALAALNRSSAPQRLQVMEETYKAWHGHLSAYANYLRVVGSGTGDDVFDMIAKEKERPSFDVSHPTWSRALFLTMALNTKMVWCDRGIAWVADTVIDLARINGFVASKLLNTFQHAKRLKPALQAGVLAALERIVDEISDDVSPTVHRQAKSYLS